MSAFDCTLKQHLVSYHIVSWLTAYSGINAVNWVNVNRIVAVYTDSQPVSVGWYIHNDLLHVTGPRKSLSREARNV